MTSRQNTLLRQRRWLPSEGWLHGIVVFIVFLLIAGQFSQLGAFEISSFSSDEIATCSENDLDTCHNTTGQKHLHACDHCLVYVLEGRQNVAQTPTNFDHQHPDDYVLVKFYSASLIAPEFLRRQRLNNRGPPLPGRKIRALPHFFLRAPNPIAPVFEHIGANQWR